MQPKRLRARSLQKQSDMRILIIGGTRFVGLAMARSAIERGHDVELFHRSPDVPQGTEKAKHLLGDRTKDFTALQTGTWDAVIDVCGYKPYEIHALADVFAGRIKKYVFVSTISVYEPTIPPKSREDAQFLSTDVLATKDLIECAVDRETYGPLKVLCEAAVEEHYENFLHIRPTFVIGPDDYTDRFTKWVNRIAAGGEVLAPEPRDAAIQYIDARDLAEFTIKCIEDDVTGPVHVAQPSSGSTYEAMLESMRSVVGDGGATLKWISAEEAAENAAEFPLWSGGTSVGILQIDTSRAIELGLKVRSVEETIKDLL